MSRYRWVSKDVRMLSYKMKAHGSDGTVALDDSESQASPTQDTIQWTPEEEKKLLRKIDLVLMPLLILGFFALQLDRSNIGNAFTDYFLQDVGINQFQFNIGNQLMYLGIVLFEIPSNLILYRVGPAFWIGFQIAAWGLVATLQAFIRGKGAGAYYATRFLLGVCECGYIPAGLYTIGRFYKTSEISKRFAWFFLGNMSANGAAGLLAYGILQMRGLAGLAGWQWLFILEGMFTILVAIAFIAFFPQSTVNPVSLLGRRYFDDHEIQILTTRVFRDDPSKINVRTHVSRNELKAALTNWRLLAHIATIIPSLAAISATFTFAPSIVASYGYGRLKANALVSIGYWLLLLTTITWGWIADKWGRRGPMVFIGCFIGMIFVIVNRVLVSSDNYQAKFAIIVLITAFSFQWRMYPSSEERSVTMAIFIMAANISGIASGQLFQAHDAPRYRTAWTVTVALSCVGVLGSVMSNLQYWVLNRRIAKRGEKDGWVYRP
ncbi:alternative sulfate transporter [Plectosphaerella plurivora]|uniref:Alternative sulfate transporter n=1 Tax=Plectosphaerella plurivora TaxID=936078 RepID=A0A9P8VJ43_9PEZI|nr:alternative sulfate transporter [Plectosphaerella plurivora]